jgi:hypothetical protein
VCVCLFVCVVCFERFCCLQNFANILEDEVFAVETEVKMILHRGLAFLDPVFEGKSVATKDVGNVTALSNVSFEYRVRGEDLALISQQTRLPFQVKAK